jgi:hypothetical protein
MSRVKVTRSSLGFAALACVMAVVLVAGIAAAQQRQSELSNVAGPIAADVPVSAQAVPNSQSTQVKLDFATVPSGKVPSQINGFELSTIEGQRNGYGMRVTDGRLNHGSPLAPDAASYLQASLAQPVTRIGATATFPAYAGSVALVVWQSSMAQPAGLLPNAGIHLVFGAAQWHFGIWESGRGETVLASGTFAAQAVDTPETFEAVRQDDTVVVTLPDGQSRKVSDPRIATWTGAFPTWELYEYKPDVAPASIHSIWAA